MESPPPLSAKFSEALGFAFELHQRQTRKGDNNNTPYLSHLLAVTSLVLENRGTEDQAIAALLHDSIEDQGNDYPGGRVQLREDIKLRFGKKVLEIVDACTDDHDFQKASDSHGFEAWERRKKAYLESLQHKQRDALLVSLADKAHNASSILKDYKTDGEDLWERFNGKREGTLWYYNELAEIFGRLVKSPLSDELVATVNELKRLANPV
jgi:(p)ppGpp synthase/HD superfamily hydrolase